MDETIPGMFFKEFLHGHKFRGGQGVDWSVNGFHALFNIDLKVIGSVQCECVRFFP